MQQQIIKSKNVVCDLKQQLQTIVHDSLFVLTDEHTDKICFPLIGTIDEVASAKRMVIAVGDKHKTLDSLARVWTFLSRNGATRHSLLINLGGGMITDLGGFAAATFKRGITYLNIPTTLLGAVDAAVGGKTGINFEGYKNEIGAFFPAQTVLIAADFFRTLPQKDILSGAAEMLKHALISKEEAWREILRFSFADINYGRLNDLAFESVQIKKHVVDEDPLEKGIRKALNAGHTIGHALESFAIESGAPVPHGFAVAWGLIAELYLSHKICEFPEEKLSKTARFVCEKYGVLHFNRETYEHLYQLMLHDKKNKGDVVNFTLLSDIGKVKTDCTTDKRLIFDALDFLFSRDNLQ